jgi:hypothetical protein
MRSNSIQFDDQSSYQVLVFGEDDSQQDSIRRSGMPTNLREDSLESHHDTMNLLAGT